MMRTEEAAKLACQLRPADVDRLADEIAEVASHIDAVMHRLLSLIRRFDEGAGWAVHGALSCAHWLNLERERAVKWVAASAATPNWRIGLDLGAARERVRVARALGALPVIDEALRRGVVSYSKVRTMTRVAAPDNEAALLEMARSATASQLEKICRGYRSALDNLQEPPESPTDEECRRFVRVRDLDDGMVCIEARLRPEEAAVVLRAFDVARRRAWPSRDDAGDRGAGRVANVSAETLPNASTPPRNRQHVPDRAPHEPRTPLARADALVAVAEAYLSAATSPSDSARQATATPVELVIHVDEAALQAEPSGASFRTNSRGTPAVPHATLDDGTALALTTAQRLACDAAVVRVATDDAGNVRTVGRRTRRISSTLRRALRVRDDACRFPGCTNRITDAHHVRHWARGGATRLDNLCLLCRRHHRLVHEHGYRIERAADGDLRFLRRDGSPVPAAAARRPLADDALARLTGELAARGVHIDALTAFPRWDGTPVDYDLVVQTLVTAAARAGAVQRAMRPDGAPG